MLEILQFIFSGFWIWLGTVFLVAVTGASISGLVQITLCKGHDEHRNSKQGGEVG